MRHERLTVGVALPSDFCLHFLPALGTVDFADDPPFDFPAFFQVAEEKKKLEEEKEMTAAWVKARSRTGSGRKRRTAGSW